MSEQTRTSQQMSHDDHDHGSSSMTESTGSGMDMDMDMDMATDEPFCEGDGRVMLNGFQAATTASVNCVLFLFEGAAVDTRTKYTFAAIGAFLMGFASEMIRYGRDRMAKKSDASFVADLQSTVAFAVQMFLAYMIMLLVMLYEYVILIMIILGLSAGHVLTLRLSAARRRAARNSGTKTPPEIMGNSSGTPCCNTDTVA